MGNSTVMDFDPEQEALASTGQIDNNNNHQKSPQVNRYTSGNSRRQSSGAAIEEEQGQKEDYAINSSALGHAFPELSDLPSSGNDDEDDEMSSIEIGRGTTNPVRRLDDSRNSLISPENSVRSSSPAIRLDYPTPRNPKPTAMRSAPRRSTSENVRRDAQLRRASLAAAHKDNIEPPRSSSKTNNMRKDQRRAVSDNFRDGYDGSILGEEQSASIEVGRTRTKASNNINANINAQVADAVEKAAREAYAKEVRRIKASNTRELPVNRAHPTHLQGDGGSHNSFLLPDLSNLSDIISGAYDDGIPVFPRHNRARTSRFVPLGNDDGGGRDASVTRRYMPLNSVPVPEDEKALFAALRVLQDKVAELELGKEEAEKKVEEIRQDNAGLKSKKTHHRKDKQVARDVEVDRLEKDWKLLVAEKKSNYCPTLFLF